MTTGEESLEIAARQGPQAVSRPPRQAAGGRGEICAGQGARFRQRQVLESSALVGRAGRHAREAFLQGCEQRWIDIIGPVGKLERIGLEIIQLAVSETRRICGAGCCTYLPLRRRPPMRYKRNLNGHLRS